MRLLPSRKLQLGKYTHTHTLIRPKLEYAAVLWSPSTKKNIKKLERIQRAATKLAPTLSELQYVEIGKIGLTYS